MLAATPAMAAPQDRAIPPELSDPAIADSLTRTLVPLSRALMDLPIGELEAAIEGDEIGPEGERELTAQVARAGPQMRAMQKALIASLPSIMASLEGVERELERAVANMPDPTYPKR